ncbi:trypsin-like peptidase domain-containing protein [Candidatus Saccharibacteria bacterium]|jgi:serine protease Do|nr:trypsin-like peptidase domain-containing protein [Candidatus Saccharibacteria bacterium]
MSILETQRPPTKIIKPKKMVSLRSSIFISIFFAIFFSLSSLIASWLILNNRTSVDSFQNHKEIISSEGEVFNKIAGEVGKSVVSINSIQEDGRGAAGTGVLINSDGLILTNKHVVEKVSESVTIVTHDSEEQQAKVVGKDSTNDIAFLQVDNIPKNIPPARLADSASVKVGDKVLAIGNTLGEFQNTVTSGIVSGIGRPIEVGDENGMSYESLFNLIQTDAAINPGNSGGPLVNINGEVIGINTAIVQEAQSLGFSIPINDIKPLISQIEQTGNLGEKAYLGVRYLNLNASIAKNLNLTINAGAVVYTSSGNPIEPGSPAQQAGIQQLDVITAINQTPVDGSSSLSSVLAKFKPGEQVSLTVFRSGVSIKLNVTLGSTPN